MFGPFAVRSLLASAPISPPNRLADSRPDPVGMGGGCSFARVGFGEVARVGASDEGFLIIEGFLELMSSAQAASMSIGPDDAGTGLGT